MQPIKLRRWVTTRQLADDATKLAGMLPDNTAGVVAIPRSGMIAASIVACHLDVPLGYLRNAKINWLPSGSRAHSGGNGPIAVIDDTTWAGRAMALARHQLQQVPSFFACVYATSHTKHLVDAYVAIDDGSDWEWNWFNNRSVLMQGVAVDMDGILCENPGLPDADDGQGLEDYRQWLLAARPRWPIRAHPARLIVTGRLERFRCETEFWLKRHRVRYDRLAMCSATVASRRGDVAAFKAAEFISSGAAIFMESDRGQAERIHALSGRQVICPDAATIWY
jgi:hypothetical protein